QLFQKANKQVLIGTVIGFYEGSYSLSEKLTEANKAIKLGADELDFVVNYLAFKKGNTALVQEEILQGTKLCLKHQKVVKWIIEVAALTHQEIAEISKLIKKLVIENFGIENAKNVFVKSSTGFFKTKNNLPNGATLETMKIISKNAKPLQIKAAGGIKDYEMALRMISLGVNRIGTSSSKAIVTKKKNSNATY
ncbi:MAG: 2-deoxyribose-5-phosphate aldolase, partial [Polaribacter sp.]